MAGPGSGSGTAGVSSRWAGRGEWDGGHIRSTQSFVEDGDELRLYYFAMDHAHGAPKKGDWQRAIGLATWQRDRLVGLRAGDEGEVITVPVPAGGELHINADASEGQLTAELVDRTGTVVPRVRARRLPRVRRRLPRPHHQMARSRSQRQARPELRSPARPPQRRGFLAVVRLTRLTLQRVGVYRC